ncbi:MAG TPA: hypothetical protein VMT16_07795, partial [Thermoanaerobaculia bacterium]|nr:hypothetical protein [Thermoanaerobaculia bacterium]
MTELPFASAATLEALELPAVLRLLASLAASDLGRDRVLALRPRRADGELDDQRRRLEEVGRLLEDGPLVPALEQPLAPLLDRAAGSGRALAGREVVELAAGLGAA